LIFLDSPMHRALAGSDAQEHGRALFADKGCAHCHGPNGVGGGKGPDLQLVRTRRTREAMITQIHDGGKQMPPFGEELSQRDIEDLVAFLRARRAIVPVPPKPAVASSHGTATPTSK
jgi:ubiquinol-cytochrome c reductase cytochrome b subunit